MSVGIDVERVDRFRREMVSSSLFISRAFTKSEREYCMSKADPCIHFAGIFAAKEAAYKAASGLAKGKLSIMQFEVVHGRNGVPRIRYTGTESEPKRIVIKISVSHTTEEAAAVALALLPSVRPHPGHE
jgi:holo-[acyl-carrier protein] synthase